jgi:hypothetical protein
MTETEKAKIECDFRQICNSGCEGTKAGRYSQSMHWEVDGFGSSKWVVLGYLDIDWVKLKNEDYLSERDIIERCLVHLNIAPEKKKYQKKQPEPKYGKLEPYKVDFKMTKENKPVIIVQFLTNQHNNEQFWAEGPLQSGVKIKREKKEKEAEPVDALAA